MRMQEKYEIRLFTKYLPLIEQMPPSMQSASTIATKLRGVVGDSQFMCIGHIDQNLRQSNNGGAFGGWEIKRTYSKKELAQAQIFWLDVRFKHLSAEEYGSRYEEYEECQHEIDALEYFGRTDFRIVHRKISCSIRAKQIGKLRFPYRKLGGTRDIFRLWGGELIVSEWFKNLVEQYKFTGATFSPTCDTAKPVRSASRPRREFAQLCVQSKPLRVTEGTRFGATPFDTQRTGYQHCEGGTIAGQQPISDVSIAGSSWDGSDLCRTEVYVGSRGGLFRPHQLLIVSKKVFDVLEGHRLRGFRYEIVGIDG